MDKIRNAAIILLGVGEKGASEILKNMSPREVRSIIEAINSIDSVTEDDVQAAFNDFFRESSGTSGIDAASREQIKNSLLSAVSNKGIGSIIHGINSDKDKWLELLRVQPVTSIVDMVIDEHPQVITALVIVVFNYLSSDSGTKMIKAMPKPLQNQVFRRMTGIGAMSKFAMDALSQFFEHELENSELNNTISIDGLETVANIISYLDSETEHEIMNELTSDNKVLGEKIQDKIFPFQRLAELDKKSLQYLLKEIKNEDLVVALKGVDDHVKEVFMTNMSTKSAEILRDEMDTKGPVKIAQVLDAQKRIIRTAKKLDEEEKIILSTKNNPDIVF
jgi:flagellar motor switch protein FliG